MAGKKAAKKVVKKDKEKKSDADDEREESGAALGGEGLGEEGDEGEEEKVEEKDIEQGAPEEKGTDVVFVNREKHARAKGILDLVTGKRLPRDANEAERTEHYRAQLQAAGVDPKGKKAVRALYEILGGLVRSESEQRAADKKAEALKSKHKKRAVESDADARNADA